MQVDVVAERRFGPHGAAHVAEALAAAVAARGQATVAFSGGSSARALLTALAHEDVPWSFVHVFQVDERVAPDGDPDRNLTTIRDLLLDRVGVVPSHVHEMPVTEQDLERAATRYAETVEANAGSPPVLDIVHLGIGGDGHTASLVPGTHLLQVGVESVSAVPPYNGRSRMTLTGPTLSRARHVLWMVSGRAKAGIVRRFVDGDPALPAVHINRSRALLLLDLSAAAGLPPHARRSENE